jgi:hypothetical protein
MPDDAFKPAFRAALRRHEIGTRTPYELSFAGKGKSGASFGFMQGDMAAGQPEVQRTFFNALAAAGIEAADIASLAQRLSVPLLSDPLLPGEKQRVDDALQRSSALVDAMDEAILQKVYAGLDACINAAGGAGCRIDPKGQIYIVMWINMTGPPTKLLTWLSGGAPALRRPVPPAGAVVDGPAMESYLQATDYFVENPGNMQHLLQSAAVGAALLPPGAVAPAPAALATPARCFTYEQATGNMFRVENGARDLIGTGYSGSEADNGKNNPHAQCERDIGPLPRGAYTIGAPVMGPSPFSLPLDPAPANEMCGRSGFLVHGDSIAHPGTASQGCIILSRPIREAIAASGINQLVVVDRL